MKNFLIMISAMLYIAGCSAPTNNADSGMDMANMNGEPEGPHTSVEWQVWAYSTAAPEFIAGGATVYDGPGGNLLREGTNGWTCLPANPRGMSDPENGWVDAHEAMPACGDAEFFKWVTAYFAGTEPGVEMEKDGYAWMLHGDMGEDNTTPLVFNKEDSKPGHWIESGPHLMRMPKDPASLDGMTTDFNSGEPYVMFSGTPYAHVMYPVGDYYKYQDMVK
jgi:hypothetical protein|tara:strand:- start:612 stop:1271 length:660 start_codon:yes stop_codon:yes gene_type:complete